MLGKNNRLDAHLRHLSCLQKSLSKVNGKTFLRSGPHKVAPIQRLKLKNQSFS